LDDGGDVDARADLYAVGVILHQLATGEVHADGAEVLASVERDETMPVGLGAILAAMLRPSREDRYSSATAAKKDLVRCLEVWRTGGVLPELTPSVDERVATVRFPDEPFGREATRSALHDCFIDATRGAPTLVLLTGAGGAGKSTLLGDLRRNASSVGSLVLGGGWSLYDRGVPFRGLASVCEQLIEWWSTLASGVREQLAATIRQALGDGCAIVTEAFPVLEAILGIHPPAPATGTIERRNRLTHCLTTLLSVLGSPERPVVLLLEDLHWADAASLPIIEGLPGRATTRNILTVASVRTGTDGVDEAFVTGLARAAEERGQTVRTLSVPPFEMADTRAFVSSALAISPSDADALATTLTDLSLGNPLALREILASATGQGLIAFDREQDRWIWSVETIRRSHLPEDVAQILANRLSFLPPAALGALRVGSCVGARFDATAVAHLLGRPAEEVRVSLDECVAAGFLLPADGDRAGEGGCVYHFRHERVQNAAYQGLGQGERERLHATRGEALLATHETDGSPGSLFEALTHLNRSHELRAGGENLALARRNLKGAELAYHATAYDTAAQLFNHANAQLPPGVWTADPTMAFGVALLLAECEYLSKRTASAERGYAAVLARDLSDNHRITTLMTRMRMLSNMGRFEESAADGLACLRLLGLEIPLAPRASRLVGPMLAALSRNWRLPADPVSVVVDQVDERTKTMMVCLADLWGPAFWFNEKLTGLVVFAMVRLSLLRGNTAPSAIGYASYGIFLAGALKRERLGKRVCSLGVAVAEKAGDPVYIGRARFMYEAFFGHLDKPLRQAPATFRNLVKTCLRGGDYPYAGASANMFLYYLPVVGVPLAQFLAEAREIIGMARQTEQSRTIMTVDILRRWIEILEGRADHSVPRFSAENAFIQGRLNESERGLYHLFEISLFYLLEDYDAAVPHVDCLPGNKMLSGYFAVYYAFFAALVLAKRGRQAGADTRWRRPFRRHHRVVSHHAQLCPENYRHMGLLLDGVMAATRRRSREARRLFEEAIDDASQQGFTQNAAIAAEWLADLLERTAESAAAERALSQARLWYHQWGCMVKVAAIDRRRSLTMSVTGANELSLTTPSRDGETSPANARPVLEAARALSNEADPARLAERLLVSIVEHTRATRGVLLIREEAELVVACERSAPRASSPSFGSAPLTLVRPPTEQADVPHLVINYVDRLGRPARLVAGSEHELFGRDPYMGRHPGTAMLCVPLMHMRQHLGVLFLEKEGNKQIFSRADLITAEILAAQAAATLSNQHEYNERLAALQNQTHPHFLFNALSGIAEMTVADPPRAERAILNLAALFRNILVSSRQAEITLKQELDLVASYLDLEKLRFGSRLTYRIAIEGDPATTLVPPLIIQPLVENSVNHGIALKPAGGSITLEATVTALRVHVRVSDTGAGWGHGSSRGAGMGLPSIRRRLYLAFGQEVELTVSKGAGVTVDLFFPNRPSQAGPLSARLPSRAVAAEPERSLEAPS